MAETVKIDLKDRKILRELDMDARMPAKELAKKLGLSRQVVKYRIERLQKEGIISGAFTIFDSAVLGKRWFRVVMQLQKISKKEKEEFIQYFKKNPHILWLGEVGGNWDFVLNFVTDDQFRFNMLFEQMLRKWGRFIQRYEVLTYISVRDQPRKYILGDYESREMSWFHEMRFNPDVKLDELDKQLIKKISGNAWFSASGIGAALGAAYKTVQGRLRKLEKNKVILGYRCFINPGRIGHESYMILLGIQTYKPELENQLYEFLKHPNVTFLVKHLGKWRIGIEVEVKDRKEFHEFLVDLRTRFGDIISEYETFPIFHDHTVNYFPEGALE